MERLDERCVLEWQILKGRVARVFEPVLCCMGSKPRPPGSCIKEAGEAELTSPVSPPPIGVAYQVARRRRSAAAPARASSDRDAGSGTMRPMKASSLDRPAVSSVRKSRYRPWGII